MAEKQSERERITARIKSLSAEEKEKASESICQRVVSLNELSKASTVMLFAPMEGEPNIWPLIYGFQRCGKTVLLPVLQEGGIVPAEYHAGDRLASNRYGTLEPDIRFARLPGSIDLIFVPGVAFDELGHRLGHGKGYYDRFLQSLACVKIGLCFQAQVDSILPYKQHDVPMDAICTEKKSILCSSRVGQLFSVKQP